MTKADLIDAISIHAELTKREAGLAVEAMMDAITYALKDGQDVTLVGFGTFSVKTRAARTGRNPQTGEAMEIPASNYVHFKPGKALKEAAN